MVGGNGDGDKKHMTTTMMKHDDDIKKKGGVEEKGFQPISDRNLTQIGSISINNSSSRCYFNFINSIRSPASRKTYEFVIRKYMQYYNVFDVDDLLLLLAPDIIENQIIKWLVSLRETVSYVTRRTYMAAILTFYEINDITIRKRKIARFLGEETTRRNKDREYHFR